jgi:cholesterol transport system auxiliary component
MMKTLGAVGITCVVYWGMAGCSLMPERLSPPAVHDFGPALATQRFAPAGWSSVAVQSPEWLQDPSLRYRLLYRQPTHVQFYALDRWVAPAPNLLEHRLAAVAGRSGCLLEIELQAFEQLFQRPDQARVVIEFRARSVDPSGDPRTVLAEKEFALNRTCSSPDAAGAVDAFSHLIDETVETLDVWLRQLPDASHCAASFSAETRSPPVVDNPP